MKNWNLDENKYEPEFERQLRTILHTAAGERPPEKDHYDNDGLVTTQYYGIKTASAEAAKETAYQLLKNEQTRMIKSMEPLLHDVKHENSILKIYIDVGKDNHEAFLSFIDEKREPMLKLIHGEEKGEKIEQAKVLMETIDKFHTVPQDSLVFKPNYIAFQVVETPNEAQSNQPTAAANIKQYLQGALTMKGVPLLKELITPAKGSYSEGSIEPKVTPPGLPRSVNTFIKIGTPAFNHLAEMNTPEKNKEVSDLEEMLKLVEEGVQEEKEHKKSDGMSR